MGQISFDTTVKHIDSGIKLDNNKYNQKLPHVYVNKLCNKL